MKELTTDQALQIIRQVLDQSLASGTIKNMTDAATILQAFQTVLTKLTQVN